MAGWKLSTLFAKKAASGAKPTAKTKARNAAQTGIQPQEASTAPLVVQQLVREPEKKSPEASLPRFNSTASDQLSGRSSDRVALMRSKVSQAFTPSQPVGDRKMFAGRERTLKTIINSLEGLRLHVVLYGERGIGKTSLLHMLSQAATEARYIVIYTSCGADSNFDETFRAAAASIPVLFHSGFSPTAEQSERGATLADLLPGGPISPRQFADLCAKLTGTRVLIVLDEFDRCESKSFRRDVAELIKNLSDRHGRVQLVLAGVASDLAQLVQHIPSIRRNIMAMQVPRMDEAEVLQIIANGEREVGFKFEPRAADLIVAVSRGIPYLANVLCYHSAQAALDMASSTIRAQAVEVAIVDTCAEFEARIGKSLQQQVQRAVDQGRADALFRTATTALSTDGTFTATDLRDLEQIEIVDAGKLLQQLLHDGLLVGLEDEYDLRYAFAEDGLATYIWLMSARESLKGAKDLGQPTEAPQRRAAGTN